MVSENITVMYVSETYRTTVDIRVVEVDNVRVTQVKHVLQLCELFGFRSRSPHPNGR